MVQQLIRDNNARFVEAYNRGDVAAVAALYTDDAVLLPPNLEMLRGREAIQQFWAGTRQMGVREAALETVQVEDSGDMACEIGAYTLKIQPEGGQATTDRGKYVVVWKRQGDGSWKLAVDIWNTNSPPASS
jgi:uncharacterized protein (TIGR02246 family)